MVYKCCVPYCKTGYASSISKDIAVFRFPKNVDLKKSGLKQYQENLEKYQIIIGFTHSI